MSENKLSLHTEGGNVYGVETKALVVYIRVFQKLYVLRDEVNCSSLLYHKQQGIYTVHWISAVL